MILPALSGLAGVAAARKDDERVGRLVGAAEALAERVGLITQLQRPTAPLLDLARTRAGGRWDDYLSEGRQMALDAAIDFAMSP